MLGKLRRLYSVMMLCLQRCVILLIGLCVATASPIENDVSLWRVHGGSGMNAPRIIGGNDADPNEYPYFVRTPFCGGVLVASEWLLTAIHCGNITNYKVAVGAYERSGGILRTCIEYIPHPEFEFYSQKEGGGRYYAPYKNDIALCKLDSPIYVDDSLVSFRLNVDANVPERGETAVVIGMGITENGLKSDHLREANATAFGKKQCLQILESLGFANTELMKRFFAGDENLCTSIGSCSGDSGGPILQKSIDSAGKIVHTHIGVSSFSTVSFGVSCVEPIVYSRTSSGIEFIKQTICNDFQSRSLFCQEPPSCKSYNEQLLEIKLVTDSDPGDLNWELIQKDGTLGGKQLLSGNNYEDAFFTYGKFICLEQGESYKFVINDSSGNGLNNVGENLGGFYELTLNGMEIGKGHDYGLGDVVDITIGMNTLCEDNEYYKFKNRTQGKTCRQIRSFGKKRRRRRMCNKKDPANGNQLVSSFCPSTCLKKCKATRTVEMNT
mmetsp:Transcript_453/g.932  ORF Transcript_453/g.932 Transcript_453/m.932 type:complete len:496 (+) Transcript_453:150-1637(+)